MTAALDPHQLRLRVRDLAAMPQIVHDVMAAIGDEDIGVDEVAARISRDPALVARSLRVANSPFYGVAGKVGSVRDALRVVGFRRLGAVLAAAAVAGRFERPACTGFDFGSFWSHSFATAICSQALAAACRLDEGRAFTAGLIHDIGRLVLATYFPRELEAAIAQAHARDLALVEAEQELLGLGHGDVGAWVAEHWRFAPPIVEAIRCHHAPPPRTPGSAPSLPDLIHAADAIVHALDLSKDGGEMVPQIGLEAWNRLGLGPDAFLRIFAQVEAAHAALRETLSI
jgi:putative nucleotidyltransferase with HDIG domain